MRPGSRATPRNLGALAALALLATLPLKGWSLDLDAPQYPDGLNFGIYPTHLAGDVQEITALNHYIGLVKLGDVARLERALWPYAIAVFALLSLAVGLARVAWGWRLVLALGPLTYPIVFPIDLHLRLRQAGHDLDPTAAFTLPPFTPPLLGPGKVGQFNTQASFGPGYYLALLAALLLGWALVLARREPRQGS